METNLKALIFGPPGSGKGTYASRLHVALNLDVVAMGDIFRETMKETTPLAKRIKNYVEKGALVPDDIVLEVLKERIGRIKNQKGFILDGFPRTISQAEALDKIVNIDVVIQLTVPDWIIVERLSTRRICRNCGEVYNIRYLKPKVEGICGKCGGPLHQRSDDTPAVIKERIGVYERQTEPILKHYRKMGIPFVEFRCEKLDIPPEVAVAEIMKGLKKQNIGSS